MVIWPFIRVRRTLFVSILLSISLFSLYRSFALSFSIGGKRAYTHPLLNRLPAFPASSPPTVSLIPFSSSSRRFSGFLARARGRTFSSRWKQPPAIKGKRRQKCCPPPAENGAVILMQVPVGPLLPSPLPATPVEVRGIRASSNTAAIPRFLLNLLTYFTFRAPSSLPFRSAFVRPSPLPFAPKFFPPAAIVERHGGYTVYARLVQLSPLSLDREKPGIAAIMCIPLRLKRSSGSKIHKRKALDAPASKKGSAECGARGDARGLALKRIERE